MFPLSLTQFFIIWREKGLDLEWTLGYWFSKNARYILYKQVRQPEDEIQPPFVENVNVGMERKGDKLMTDTEHTIMLDPIFNLNIFWYDKK